MNQIDAPRFTEAVNSLAEVFGKNALGPKAMNLWFGVLKEFDCVEVCTMLGAWPKTNSKFPAPADVWKALNERATDTRERIAAAEKKVFEEGWKKAAATPYGRQKLLEIKQILSAPKPTPDQHWRRVLKTPGLPEATYRMAESFFAKRSLEVMREPGQDEEELSEMPL